MKEGIIDLKGFREKLGISQGSLAHIIGIPKTTLSRWEAKETITLEAMLKIEKYYKNIRIRSFLKKEKKEKQND